MSRIRWYGPSLLLLVTLVLTMLLGPRLVREIARSYENARIAQVRQGLADNPTLTTLSDAFKDVATVIRPSVTSITILARGDRNSANPGVLEPISNGSGWVYRHYTDFGGPNESHEEFIITNHHVVEKFVRGQAEQIIVRFDDGGEYHATVVGTDPQTDIAVLKIDREGLIPASVALDPAEQGEIVFAVGSPFQFDFSMSQGIVSATGRRVNDMSINSYENYIQTDAAINPGNSGGPLVNVRGQVAGMNTAIAVTGRPESTFSGLGFAIPVSQIMNVADQLIASGEVRRGYIGVYVSELDYATASEMGYSGKGVLCAPAINGPAERAGFRIGDIITHIERQPVTTPDELRIAVSSHPPNTEIAVRIWRDERSRTLRITLGGSPGFGGSRTLESPFEPDPQTRAYRMGIAQMHSLTPLYAMQSRWAYTPGVLITSIVDHSPASDENIAPMTVITEVNGQLVYDVESLLLAIQQSEGDEIRLLLKRWSPLGDGGYDAREVTLSVP